MWTSSIALVLSICLLMLSPVHRHVRGDVHMRSMIITPRFITPHDRVRDQLRGRIIT